MPIIKNEAIEEAVNTLARLDDSEAELRAAKEFGEARLKEIYSIAFIAAEGNNAEREAIARTSPDYINHLNDLRTVILNHAKAKNKRDSLTMVVDIWRTEQASMRGRT